MLMAVLPIRITVIFLIFIFISITTCRPLSAKRPGCATLSHVCGQRSTHVLNVLNIGITVNRPYAMLYYMARPKHVLQQQTATQLSWSVSTSISQQLAPRLDAAVELLKEMKGKIF